MDEEALQLFAVQCGRSEREASTSCLLALDPADAIVRSKAEQLRRLSDRPNPFEQPDAKVRVGTFDPVHEGKINFGHWIPL